EGRFNGLSQMGGKGPYANFAQSEYVRVLGAAGPETTFESLGVEDWKYVSGAYEVQLLFQMTSSQSSSVLLTTLRSSEGKRTERRQWHVLWEKTGLRRDQPTTISDEGTRLYAAARESHEYLLKYWTGSFKEGKVAEAFLQTVPAAERQAVRDAAQNKRLS